MSKDPLPSKRICLYKTIKGECYNTYNTKHLTLPGCPLYEKPGFIMAMAGLAIDTKLDRNKIHWEIHQYILHPADLFP